MFKNIANLASMMRQAQEVGGKLKEVNEQLKGKRVSASVGGGMIEVEANGLGEILRVKIDPELFARDDREMIEDLLPSAVNQVVAKSKQLHMEMMTQDLDIPGLGDALAEFTKPNTDA
jgi:DNA-binding YbaB/EbfC family protein